MYRKEHFRRT